VVEDAPSAPGVSAGARDRALRLVLISAAFPPLGAGEAANTLHLCRRLAERGHDVHLVTTRREGLAPVPGFSLHPVMRRWSWREAPRLRRCVLGLRPDGVILLYLGSLYGRHPMITFSPTLLRRARPGLRFVTRVEHPTAPARADEGRGIARLAGRVARRLAAAWAGPERVSFGFGTLLRDSDAVIALCRHHLALLREADPGLDGRAVVIPPPTNLPPPAGDPATLRAQGRTDLGVPQDAFLVGYLGYLYRDKGIETLLRAVARLAEAQPRLRLVLMGGPIEVPGMSESGPRYVERMKRLADELGIADRTRFTGPFQTGDASLVPRIHAVDAFALPFATGVQLNNSSVSALSAQGACLVTTRTVHSDPEFRDGVNMLLCAPGDAAGLADALARVAADPALAARLRDGLRALAEERFAWPACLDRTLALVRGPGADGP